MATAAAQQQPFPLAGAVQAPGENQGAVKLTVQVDVAHKRPYPRAGGGKRSRGMYRFGFSTVSNIGGQAVVRADAAIGGNLITSERWNRREVNPFSSYAQASLGPFLSHKSASAIL